ncbi:hypothetical protein HDK77DRAFT_479012 [Phyllosticta capitalensis]|uniref:Uncharacterized protein n=1 Tax=Phyllosticta capitalensis TaxID=121624 RepID=A0ABR1Z0U2_9PEZI
MPQTLTAPSYSPSGGRSPSPSSRNRSTPNATATQAPAPTPTPTPQIHVASWTPTPPLPSPAAPTSQASSRAPSPRVASQHTRRPSTSPSGSTTSRNRQPDDADHLRAVNAGFERAMAGTSTVRARAKSDTGPSSDNSPKASSPSIWERAGSARRSGEVDDELERRWGAWERGEDLPLEHRAKPKSTKSNESGKRGGGGTIRDEEEGPRPPPQPAPGLLKRLRSKIVKDKDRVKEKAEKANDPSPDHKYGPY